MCKSDIFNEMKLKDYKEKNIIYLDTEIDRESQVKFCRELEFLAKRELDKSENSRKPITIKITSYGGSMFSVFAMISWMEYWQEKGITIRTIADGFTASGGSKILCAGTKGERYITRYGNILIHQTQLYVSEVTQAELVDRTKDTIKNWNVICDILRKHTNLTEEDLEGFTKYNMDVTYRPEEAVKKGIVDKII